MHCHHITLFRSSCLCSAFVSLLAKVTVKVAIVSDVMINVAHLLWNDCRCLHIVANIGRVMSERLKWKTLLGDWYMKLILNMAQRRPCLHGWIKQNDGSSDWLSQCQALLCSDVGGVSAVMILLYPVYFCSCCIWYGESCCLHFMFCCTTDRLQ